MVAFEMCPACRAEYENPADRRFHAQAIACPVCGPQLSLRTPTGAILKTNRPLETFAKALRGGQIGAMKGLGGFHLLCDARQTQAVHLLRTRKHRDEKPFAILVADAAAAKRACAS